jgi:hypothetical protein
LSLYREKIGQFVKLFRRSSAQLGARGREQYVIHRHDQASLGRCHAYLLVRVDVKGTRRLLNVGARRWWSSISGKAECQRQYTGWGTLPSTTRDRIHRWLSLDAREGAA